LKAAGQLGYFKGVPNGLITNELKDAEARSWTGTILVLFPNVRYQNTDSLYWGPVFNGISSRLNQKGLNILTLTEPTDDSMFSLLNPEAIRGIITVGTVSTTILLEIKRLGIPVVMVDHLDSSFHCDTVFTDNISCMREIMVELIRKGYKRFQFIGNIKEAQSFYERWLGFRSVLDDYNIELNQIPELIGPFEHVYDTLIEAVKQHGLPDVFVCANDSHALFSIEALEAIGINVPDQCRLTGFDNTYPTLPIAATVNIDKELLGKRAVDQMLWRILNPNSTFEKKLIQAEVMFKE